MGGLFEPIRMQYSTKVASPPDKINWMHADLQIEVENGFSSMIEKLLSGIPRALFFKYKKTIILPVPSGFPYIAPVVIRFQRISIMSVFLFNVFIRPLLPTLL